MVLQIVFQTEFAHLPGGLRRQQKHSIESDRHFSSSPDCSNTAGVPFLLVGRLFQPCHFPRIDEVLKCGDSMTNLHILSEVPSSCVCITTFGLCDGSKNFDKFCFRLM